MGTIFCLIGKSSCGKDTIYKHILAKRNLPLSTLVSYTTRPIRNGETDGVEYYFVSNAREEELQRQGKIIELRAYHTVHGIWKYFTVNDHQIDLSRQSYLVIGTLESYLKLRDYFGSSHVSAIYVEVEQGERLQRALDRERAQQEPKYTELCRRFLADEADFSPENLRAGGITRCFWNGNLEHCVEEITSYLKEQLSRPDDRSILYK